MHDDCHHIALGYCTHRRPLGCETMEMTTEQIASHLFSRLQNERKIDPSAYSHTNIQEYRSK